jgi:hypothetical protein
VRHHNAARHGPFAINAAATASAARALATCHQRWSLLLLPLLLLLLLPLKRRAGTARPRAAWPHEKACTRSGARGGRRWPVVVQ